MDGMRSVTVCEKPAHTGRTTGTSVGLRKIRGYLDELQRRGRSRETICLYEAKLAAFYGYLPPSKRVTQKTLADWREALLQQYSPSTVNTYLSVVNGLLEYLGRRDLQLVGQLEAEPEPSPELTRAEYVRMLQAARTLGRERTYLLIKVFALTGIRVGELFQLTAEAVASGWLPAADGGKRQRAAIPTCLREELLQYLQQEGIPSGPVFLTRNGRPMRRTQVTGDIRALCRDAQVDPEKGSPRCLRKLYQTARAEVEQRVRLLAEQAYERMLNAEQRSAGWDTGRAGPPQSLEEREEVRLRAEGVSTQKEEES